MKEVFFSDSYFEAQLAIGRLGSDGIEAYMYNLRGIVPDIEPRYVKPFSGSVSVMVRYEDYERAEAILAQVVALDTE